MAAEALLGVVFENLLSLATNEFATLSGIKSKTEKLSKNLDLIKAVLEDAEEKQVTERAIKVWLQQLKDAVYVLDDILDECSIESHRLSGSSSFNPKNIMFRCRIGSQLKEIMGTFDQIAAAKNTLLLREGVGERPNEVPESRQTSSTIAQPKVYGRDEDKKKVVEFLLNQAQSSDFLSIYPIFGLGGVGKTTLAQLVYNDARVSTHFNFKIWVCVSENFSVQSILCSIIESIQKKKPDISNLDVMEGEVRKLLQHKKYLLVLDDVWKRNDQLESGLTLDKWSKLRSVLSCESKGASILVTTRDEDVAAIMGTCQAHHLSVLSDDDCWLLFKQCAFGPNKEERAELVQIGRDIVRKCGGSPLAARALGGMLRSKNGQKEWLEVKESPLWTLPDENDILPALWLSYFHLTPTLKQCFAFCAIFPKDWEINKEELIHLWMGNGFISSRRNMEVEDVGNMIWNELYQKSFFQDIKTEEDSGETSFKMHDLIHDLAQSVMGQECLIWENENTSGLSNRTHHVGFETMDQSSFNRRARSFKQVESLRTVYHLGLPYDGQNFYYQIPTNRSLRVLRISSSNLSSLGDLIHLRYLELSSGYDQNIKTLPTSICGLRKLEILKLRALFKLERLPEHLSDLENLRHLIISDCWSLSHMFPNIRKLSCLRTLSVYIVESKRGHSLAELRDLNLGRELRIERLQNVGSVSEAEAANLKCKQDLKELCLSWDYLSDATKDEQVFEALQPHSNLKKLTINHYNGLHFPSWIGNLSALEELIISNCDEFESFPEQDWEGLRSLRTLRIDLCWGLRSLPNELVKLSALEELSIKRCNELKSFPEQGWEGLRSLRTLRIDGCSGLRSLPNELVKLSALEELSISHCGWLKSFPEQGWEGLCSLRTVKIDQCWEFRSLPEGVQHLTSLEDLTIVCCPELEKRCEEETGEDWHKIAHVPKVRLSPWD